MKNSTKITNFYKDQTILLTGATGFLGKATVEKLLRACDPKKIFILIRSKKGIDPEKRKESLFDQAVYNRLKLEVPDFLNRVVVVSGDISEKGLALSNDVYNDLCQEVNVVFHSAASVNFDENLKSSVRTNVNGTMEIISLCKSMHNLKAVVHISTAYSNAVPERIEVGECFYKPPIQPEALMEVRTVEDKDVEIICSRLLDQWPNTYSFTKAVAESIVEKYGKGLPIAVFRPAIISGSYEEPEEGWVDNLYGATGLMVGGGAGVLRVLYICGSTKAQIVPVDFTVNAILALGCKIGSQKIKSHSPAVYNYAVPKNSGLNFEQFTNGVRDLGATMPLSKTIWYYTSVITNHPFIFNILNLLFHIAPAYFFDFLLYIQKGKTRLVRVYQKVLKFMKLISFFTNTDWDFHLNNIYELWDELDEDDKKIFNFNMHSIDWQEYMRRNVIGVRFHIFNESLDNVPKTKARYFKLYLLHRLVQLLFYGTIFWCIISNFFPELKSVITNIISI